jgi:hypothetical protein
VDRGGVRLQAAAGTAGVGGNSDAAVGLGTRVGVEHAAANIGARIGARVAAAITASVELG